MENIVSPETIRKYITSINKLLTKQTDFTQCLTLSNGSLPIFSYQRRHQPTRYYIQHITSLKHSLNLANLLLYPLSFLVILEHFSNQPIISTTEYTDDIIEHDDKIEEILREFEVSATTGTILRNSKYNNISTRKNLHDDATGRTSDISD